LNDPMPIWPAWLLGLIAVVSGGICLALRIDPGWAVIGTSFAGLPVIAWVEFRRPPPSQSEPPEIDEEVVRRLEALAARMREELEARRAATPAA
jgi:hypothetical protein